MRGILLVNLGSPNSTSIRDVRKYLRQFLMDPFVIDVPWILRAFIVYGTILPFRPKVTAHAYQSIWKKEGSPLITMSKKVCSLVADRVDAPVELAMRYGEPSIQNGIKKLLARGVKEIFLVPLYPHYALASYETVIVEAKKEWRRLQTHFTTLSFNDRRVARQRTLSTEQLHRAQGSWRDRTRRRRGCEMGLTILPPFYNDPHYIRALVESARPYLVEPYDHLLVSFHGLPERHLQKVDEDHNYRTQAFATTKLFADALNIPKEKYSISFQSRLGKDPWIQPFTDQEFLRLAKEGVKRLVVISPAFVSDCLETLEELGIRGREAFLEAGGEEFRLIPCLNDHPLWIEALQHFISSTSGSSHFSRSCNTA